MRQALLLANEAAEEGETPVGCVIADPEGNIIGRGRNRREEKQLSTAHAEIEAIEEACRAKNSWRLSGCSLYVTLEPCPMCAGAIMNSRLSHVYYGAKEEQSGSCGSVINLFMENYGVQTAITGGILGCECGKLLSDFFRGLRRGVDKDSCLQ
ncbi:MAG: nucleoside deaminase [Oscillospiraceae bacterium]|nr:nucleoside deaminase [Oscillospiraceae bacterium]